MEISGLATCTRFVPYATVLDGLYDCAAHCECFFFSFNRVRSALMTTHFVPMCTLVGFSYVEMAHSF